jgi:hypothetical protein
MTLLHFTPAARRHDPVSSHDAANEHTDSGRRERHVSIVVEQVWMHPGLTSAELTPHTGLERHEVARRLLDAEENLQVMRGDLRRCSVSGRLAITWWPRTENAA